MNTDNRPNIPSGQTFVLVPATEFESMKAILGQIKAVLEDRGTIKGLDDYLSEKEAIRFLGRGPTWLWDKRKRGELAFTKVGNRVLYIRSDLLAYLDAHRVESFANKHGRT
jgi:hypothetical protein